MKNKIYICKDFYICRKDNHLNCKHALPHFREDECIIHPLHPLSFESCKECIEVLPIVAGISYKQWYIALTSRMKKENVKRNIVFSYYIHKDDLILHRQCGISNFYLTKEEADIRLSKFLFHYGLKSNEIFIEQNEFSLI